MIEAENFVTALREGGFRLFAGVPCSHLAPLIDFVIDSPHCDYVGVANEGDGIAVACGAELAGRRSVVLFQNSGFGNAVNPLTSLALPFRIPVLLLVTHRGAPERAADEPQHDTMGRITPQLFELMRIPWEPFPAAAADVPGSVARAIGHMDATGTPFALVVPRGALASYTLRTKAPERRLPSPSAPAGPAPPPLAPDDALAAIRAGAGQRAGLLATTGFTGRALYRLGDRPNQLYMVGSMGCVASLALGLAKARPQTRFVAIDGDGALLMRMGALATIGFERPANLTHVVLDNGVHDSTGAQATVATRVDFAAVAQACGYPRVVRARDAEELRRAVGSEEPGPTLVHAYTNPRPDRRLPRPTVSPAEVAARFRSWLAEQ